MAEQGNDRGFIIPELIIESIIRDGFLNVKTNKAIIDDLFNQLRRTFASPKYGEAEITKIKAMVDKDIAILYSYNQVDAKDISVSIMVGTDDEDKPRAHLEDHYEQVSEPITDEEELEALNKVEDLEVLSYDPNTGKVTVSDATNLAPVYRGMIYVDESDPVNEHPIIGAIDVTPGNKCFYIAKNVDVVFGANTGYIRSSLNWKEYQVKGVTDQVNLIVGCHSKDALTTKYLYTLVKYFILSRKPDMIARGLYLASFNGSDFNRDQAFIGDQVYTRFLTVTGKTDNLWRGDQVVLVDRIDLNCYPEGQPDFHKDSDED